MADSETKGAEPVAATEPVATPPDVPKAHAPPKKAKPKAKPKAAPKKPPQFSQEEFVSEMDDLFGRARDAGVRPLKVMAATLFKGFLDLGDRALGMVDEGTVKKPAPKRKKKPASKA